MDNALPFFDLQNKQNQVTLQRHNDYIDALPLPGLLTSFRKQDSHAYVVHTSPSE